MWRLWRLLTLNEKILSVSIILMIVGSLVSLLFFTNLPDPVTKSIRFTQGVGIACICLSLIGFIVFIFRRNRTTWPRKLHPVQLRDTPSIWSNGLEPCERCGEPNHFNPDEMLLTKFPCPGCGKYPWVIQTSFFVTFCLYWATVIAWIFGGAADVWSLPGKLEGVLIVIGGFFGYIIVLYCVLGLWYRVVKRRIKRKIAKLKIQLSQNPGNIELMGRVSTLYSFLKYWYSCLVISEEALRFNPENHLIKERVDYARAAVKDPNIHFNNLLHKALADL